MYPASFYSFDKEDYGSDYQLIPQISVMDQHLVQDGSMDYMGRIADKRKTGSWKSCWPILAYNISDTAILLALVSNIITYMTGVLHIRTARSASDVNNFQGAAFLMSVVGGFISDTYLGRYKTIVLAVQVYFSGLILLTISVSVESLRPLPCQNGACPHASSFQLGIFFLAMYLIALGFGSLKCCIVSFGADQFEEEDVTEKRGMVSFFNWGFWCANLGGILAVTAIVYIEDRLSWGWGIGILLVFLAVSMCMFFAMTKHYRYRKPQGSPLAQIGHVLITAFRRRKLKTGDDFYEEHDISHDKRLLPHTTQFRFLDKAALKGGGSLKPCTLTTVEENREADTWFPFLAMQLIPGSIRFLALEAIPPWVSKQSLYSLAKPCKISDYSRHCCHRNITCCEWSNKARSVWCHRQHLRSLCSTWCELQIVSRVLSHMYSPCKAFWFGRSITPSPLLLASDNNLSKRGLTMF